MIADWYVYTSNFDIHRPWVAAFENEEGAFTEYHFAIIFLDNVLGKTFFEYQVMPRNRRYKMLFEQCKLIVGDNGTAQLTRAVDKPEDLIDPEREGSGAV
jgi:hypothetical protein